MKSLILTVFSFLLLTACSSSVVDCSDVKQMKNVGDEISSVIPKDAKVTNIYFTVNSTGSTVGTGFSSVRVCFDTPDKEYKVAEINFEDNNKSTISDNKTYVEYFGKGVLGRDIANYDFGQIATNINKAESLLKEKNIEVSGIDNYTIQIYENPQDDSHTFDLLSKNGSTKFTGRKISTEYLVIECEADSEGNVTFPEIEE